MDMVRWLLGNRIVQVTWGLGILAVLLAWAFGGNKAADHSTSDADTNVKTELVADASSTKKKADVKTEVTAEVKQEIESVGSEAKAVVAASTAAVVATAAATTKVIADTSEVDVEVAKELKSTETGLSEEVASTEEAVTEVAQAVAETKVEGASEVTADTKASSLVSSLADKSTDDLLMMAREAYWGNGLDESAEIYTVLIEREPDAIEYKGELGNVFWRQGFPKKAAELYADIAEPMIEKGNGERVSNMVGFIGLFFPERAASIRELLAKQFSSL